MHFAGWEAAAAGLQPGQVILKVNGTGVNRSDYQDVLEHFTAQHTHQEPLQPVSPTGRGRVFGHKQESQVLTFKSQESGISRIQQKSKNIPQFPH